MLTWQVGLEKGRGLLLLAEMSSKGALATGAGDRLQFESLPAIASKHALCAFVKLSARNQAAGLMWGAACLGAYTEKVAEAAAANQDFVMGFICQSPANWATAVPPGD